MIGSITFGPEPSTKKLDEAQFVKSISRSIRDAVFVPIAPLTLSPAGLTSLSDSDLIELLHAVSAEMRRRLGGG